MPHPPSEPVLDKLLDVPAPLLLKGEGGVDDDVGGAFLPFGELMLPVVARVIGMLLLHEVPCEVERRLAPVTSVKPPPSCAYPDAHSPWRGGAVYLTSTCHVMMQQFDQLVQRNHLIGLLRVAVRFLPLLRRSYGSHSCGSFLHFEKGVYHLLHVGLCYNDLVPFPSLVLGEYIKVRLSLSPWLAVNGVLAYAGFHPDRLADFEFLVLFFHCAVGFCPVLLLFYLVLCHCEVEAGV